jgi:hypothetical protein
LIYAATHDGLGFVIYTSDGPSYAKLVFSPAEFERLMAACAAFALTHGVIWTMRPREPEEYQG